VTEAKFLDHYLSIFALVQLLFGDIFEFLFMCAIGLTQRRLCRTPINKFDLI